MRKLFLKKSLCFIFLINSFLSFSQFKEPNFGKIELSELEMTKYDKDTTAGALMLFDNGSTKFILNQENKFQFVFERHFRIKIFKKSAFNLANFKFDMYRGNLSREVLNTLKASTFNLVNGKVVQTKVNRDNIFEEESKSYTTKKFAFPEVKEGSIIELSYSITSDFLYNLRGWKFQYNYPALWSQYNFVIPEYFNYRQFSKGYLSYAINKIEDEETTFKILNEATYEARSHTQTEYENIIAKTKDVTLATKDVPAFISEPNIDCEDNYIQSLDFELSSIQYPGHVRKDYAQTWESVNKEMIEDDEFGLLLKSKGFINDTVKILCKDKASDLDKASAIYNYVQKRMKWNDNYRLYSKRGLKKPYEERAGSSSEINLLLTLMLQSAGLNANPVIFSTRDNGNGFEFYPTISKFNSVLSKLEIDGKTYLLDATNEFCPFGILPSNDINEKGRVVNNETGDWVNLDNSTKHKETKVYSLNILPDGKLTGTIIGKYDGYAGINYRENLSHEKSNDDYIRKKQENLKGLSINGYSIVNKSDIAQPLSDSLNVEITDNVEKIGDKILFQPLLYETISKNRYTLEDRKYPVNYNYPISELYIFNYMIPDGYEVESIPLSRTMKLPDNSIVVSYNIQTDANVITIVYKRSINKNLFLPNEYLDLKEFYNQLVKKHSEQIILKKK